MRQDSDIKFLTRATGKTWLMDLPERLRWLRKNARPRPLLQEELAEILGSTQSFVSQAELGKRRRLSPEEVAEWAEACGYFGVLVFVTNKQIAEDGPALLEEAEPETLSLVLTLLRAIPAMGHETRSAITRILESLSEPFSE